MVTVYVRQRGGDSVIFLLKSRKVVSLHGVCGWRWHFRFSMQHTNVADRMQILVFFLSLCVRNCMCAFMGERDRGWRKEREEKKTGIGRHIKKQRETDNQIYSFWKGRSYRNTM